MEIKITFDFHDIFVDSKNAWIKAFKKLCDNKQILEEYNNKVSKQKICEKYCIDYNDAEMLYRQNLKLKIKNVEFARKLSKVYEIDIVSMSRGSRLKRDIEKFNFGGLFSKIYSKEDIKDRDKFLINLSKRYDWLVFFNHEISDVKIEGNLIYIPINFEGKLDFFKNISFTEHAKNKLLYNELSQYYMQAIANNTEKETNFIKYIFTNYVKKSTGSILDCCCGVGRHDFMLGDYGFYVDGIDISSNQISTANKIHSHPNVNYHVMDVRNFSLDKKNYDMAICMWTTYNYLSLDRDFVSFLKAVYNHQSKDSILILDSKNIPSLPKHRIYKRSNVINGVEMELLVNKRIINNIQNSQYFYFIKEKGIKKFFIDQEYVRFYHLDELKNLTKGLYNIVKVFGNFDCKEYDEKNSERFIVILKRK